MCSKLSSSLLLTFVVASLIQISCCKPAVKSECSNWESIVDKYGAQVFLLGDRSLVIPADGQDMEANLCPRLLSAGDKLKSTIRSCLAAFPKTVAGLLVRGSRQTIKEKCSAESERNLITKHLTCVRDPSKLSHLHDQVDTLTRKLTYISTDAVPVNKRLDLTCCSAADFRKTLRAKALIYCNQEATDYAMQVVEDMLKDALDLACGAYRSEPAKCGPVLASTPELLNVTGLPEKRNEAFLVPLIQVLSSI